MAAIGLCPCRFEEAATVTPGRGDPARAAERLQGPHGRYGLLLILLILTYLLSAFTSGTWIGIAQLLLFVATGFLALRSSGLPPRRMHVIAVLGLIGSAVSVGLAVTRPNHAAVAAASIWTGVLLLATVVVIVRRILSFATVTAQSIYAAISAYLILGLMFAAFYAAVSLLHGGHFFAQDEVADSKTYQYFSFTTLTTLGYGDFTAADSGGRAVAVVEALTGQIFLATLVARLVAAFRGPAAQQAAPTGSGPPPDAPPTVQPQPAAAGLAVPAPAGQGSGGQGSAAQGSGGHERGRRPPASMRPGRQPRRPSDSAARARRRQAPRPPGQ